MDFVTWCGTAMDYYTVQRTPEAQGSVVIDVSLVGDPIAKRANTRCTMIDSCCYSYTGSANPCTTNDVDNCVNLLYSPFIYGLIK